MATSQPAKQAAAHERDLISDPTLGALHDFASCAATAAAGSKRGTDRRTPLHRPVVRPSFLHD